MEAQKFLRQYQMALQKIDLLTEQIERLRVRAQGAGGSFVEIGRGSGPSSAMEHCVVMIVELEQELQEWVRQAVCEERTITRVIYSLENKEHVAVLVHRYIEGLLWKEIALEMRYTERHVKRLHQAALLEIEKVVTQCPFNMG